MTRICLCFSSVVEVILSAQPKRLEAQLSAALFTVGSSSLFLTLVISLAMAVLPAMMVVHTIILPASLAADNPNAIITGGMGRGLRFSLRSTFVGALKTRLINIINKIKTAF